MSPLIPSYRRRRRIRSAKPQNIQSRVHPPSCTTRYERGTRTSTVSLLPTLSRPHRSLPVLIPAARPRSHKHSHSQTRWCESYSAIRHVVRNCDIDFCIAHKQRRDSFCGCFGKHDAPYFVSVSPKNLMPLLRELLELRKPATATQSATERNGKAEYSCNSGARRGT
jgi:hypothetical protein